MRDTLDDELDGAIQLKLREYKQSYKWLFIILCLDLGLGVFYFALNHYSDNNPWIYDYYRLFNAIFMAVKLPLFIIAMVKVKPVSAKIVLLLTLIIGLVYFIEDWWRYFSTPDLTSF